MAGAGVISCPACGASYPWKPQLSGKKVRCKCGKLFEARPPKALPAEPVAEPDIIPVDEDSDVSVIESKRKMPTVMRPAARGGATGAATASPPTIAPADLGAAYPTHGRRRVVTQEAADDDSKKKLIVPLIAILVLLVGGGIFAGLALKGGMLGSSKPMLGDDKMIIGMIQDENGTEVKEWLKSNSRHMFFNMTEGQANGLADRLYAMGAIKVYAFGEMISKSIAVELPDDPVKRKALFEYEQQHNGWRSKSKDVGQKYFLLWM